jgi:hypothetical protein
MIAIRLPSHFPVRATEWMLASMKLSWGLLLLMPYDMFHAPATATMLRGLSQTAPQAVWGWIGTVAGLLHLSGLYVNGTRRKSPHVRATCSAIGAVFWFQVTIGMIGTGVPSTGWAIYPWLVVFSVYNVVRAAQDARQSDDRARAAGELIGGGK